WVKAEARPTTWAGLEVVTVGHSTRSLEELIRLLREAEVTTLADIRTIRRSRHNPQFEETSLASALRAAGIEYLPIEELGGLRHARKHSVNDAWRNANFRGFADHMQTATFERGLERLHSAAASGVVCLLCAEAVPWRCHRSLVAD